MNRLDELLKDFDQIAKETDHPDECVMVSVKDVRYVTQLLRAGREMAEAVDLAVTCQTTEGAWEASKALRRARTKYNKAEANNV